ncbi:MAG: hypothetical protein IPM55_21730 [Acidobacteria bacterium]|nr:hypothetical protein [Acidobacteriota bacterium]
MSYKSRARDGMFSYFRGGGDGRRESMHLLIWESGRSSTCGMRKARVKLKPVSGMEQYFKFPMSGVQRQMTERSMKSSSIIQQAKEPDLCPLFG